MATLNRTEQWLLAGLLTLFVAGSAVIAWQQKRLERALSLEAPAIPFHPAVAAAPAASKPQTVSLHSATQEEWEALPGIGPALARQIVQYRQSQPFAAIEDLLKVPGIGPKKLEKIRPYLKESSR